MKYIIQTIAVALVGTGAWLVVSLIIGRNLTPYDLIVPLAAFLILSLINFRPSKK